MADLTERDLRTLRELVDVCFPKGPYRQTRRSDGATPLDVGGSNGSHHSATLTKLVRLGYAEHKKLGCDWGQAPTHQRGSKVYRPTEKGRNLVEGKG